MRKTKTYDKMSPSMEIVRLLWIEAQIQRGPKKVTTQDVMDKFRCSLNSASNSMLSYRRMNPGSIHYHQNYAQIEALESFQPVLTKGVRPSAILDVMEAITNAENVKMAKDARTPEKSAAA